MLGPRGGRGLVAVLFHRGEHLAHRALHHNVADHAEALAVGVERLQRCDHQLVLRLVELERVDLESELESAMRNLEPGRSRLQRNQKSVT